MSNAARVSVVVPVHRVEPYVAACLASIAAQELAPCEVLLVDDRGGDRSIDVARDAADRLGLPVAVVTMEGNSGVGAARNAGLRRAEGDVVWFCDADDAAHPRFLAELTARMARDATVIATARTVRFGAGPDTVVETLTTDGVLTGAQAACAVLRNELRGYACNKLVTRALALEHPFAEGVFHEDLDAFLARALAAGRVSVCPEPLYRYRVRPDSMSGGFSRGTLDLLDQERRVEGILAGRDEVGARGRRRYRYENVILPLANTAARAGHRDREARAALGRAARRVRVADLPALAAAGERGLALAAAVLKASPRLYGAVLRRR